MQVKINGKLQDQARADVVLNTIEEYDELEEQIAEMRDKLRELELKATICEAKLVEGLSDTERLQNDGVVSIQIYSVAGNLTDERDLKMSEVQAPKKMGAKGIRNMLIDLIQQGHLKLNSDKVFAWIEDNGYETKLSREEVIEEITALEMTKIFKETVEKDATVKRKIRRTLKKKTN